jgi:hypothetical protein
MRNQIHKIIVGLSVLVALTGLLACNLVSTPNPPTPTEIPLYLQVTLTSVDHEESGTGPDFTLTTHTPVLTGLDDPRLTTFNQQMALLVQDEVDAFKQNLLMLTVEPIANGSFLDVGFEQVSPTGNLLSLKFAVDFYSDGAAHPGSYSHTATYDLQAGSFLSLYELFIPGADYLGTIATCCKNELATRDIGFDPSAAPGADPSTLNYQNWNITADGLLITFDAYQVAAYAAGPQLVTIPYGELLSIINPDGPLVSFLP